MAIAFLRRLSSKSCCYITMQIIAPNSRQRLASALRRIEKRNAILRRLRAQRAHDWHVQTGVRRLITRIRIELWVWREARREQRRIDHDDSPYNV